MVHEFSGLGGYEDKYWCFRSYEVAFKKFKDLVLWASQDEHDPAFRQQIDKQISEHYFYMDENFLRIKLEELPVKDNAETDDESCEDGDTTEDDGTEDDTTEDDTTEDDHPGTDLSPKET